MKICKYTQEQEAIKIVARENSGNEGLVYPTADTWNLWIKGGGGTTAEFRTLYLAVPDLRKLRSKQNPR